MLQFKCPKGHRYGIGGYGEDVEVLQDQVTDLTKERDDLDEEVIMLKDEQKDGMADAMEEIAELAGKFS